MNDSRGWSEITRLFNFPANCPNASHIIRLNYMRWLEAFERRYLHDDESVEQEVRQRGGSYGGPSGAMQRLAEHALAALILRIRGPRLRLPVYPVRVHRLQRVPDPRVVRQVHRQQQLLQQQLLLQQQQQQQQQHQQPLQPQQQSRTQQQDGDYMPPQCIPMDVVTLPDRPALAPGPGHAQRGTSQSG